MRTKLVIFILAVLFSCASQTVLASGRVKGIYINLGTLGDTKYINYLIARSKEVGINTFVVDAGPLNNVYKANLQAIKNSGIKYVARIVFFPDGGNKSEILSPAYWEKRYHLAEQAISVGADAIQLDYIRYKPSQPASHQNAIDIYNIVHWFKEKLDEHHIPLQIDVFGITSFGESKHIGQDIRLLGQTIDALCPMVYPSHYEPYREHSAQPYKTIVTSLEALKVQLNHKIPFKLIPYIETHNFRYWHPDQELLAYVYAQIKATEDSQTDGWYAWSPQNKYDKLFLTLKTYPVKS